MKHSQIQATADLIERQSGLERVDCADLEEEVDQNSGWRWNEPSGQLITERFIYETRSCHSCQMAFGVEMTAFVASGSPWRFIARVRWNIGFPQLLCMRLGAMTPSISFRLASPDKHACNSLDTISAVSTSSFAQSSPSEVDTNIPRWRGCRTATPLHSILLSAPAPRASSFSVPNLAF